MTDLRFPMLRLELDTSKLTLLKALDDRHAELQEMVRNACDRAIPEIQKQIDVQMNRAIQAALAEALGNAAEQAVEAMREQLEEGLAEKLKDALERRFR